MKCSNCLTRESKWKLKGWYNEQLLLKCCMYSITLSERYLGVYLSLSIQFTVKIHTNPLLIFICGTLTTGMWKSMIALHYLFSLPSKYWQSESAGSVPVVVLGKPSWRDFENVGIFLFHWNWIHGWRNAISTWWMTFQKLFEGSESPWKDFLIIIHFLRSYIFWRQQKFNI